MLSQDQRIRVTVQQLELRRHASRLVWLDADSLILAGSGQRWVVPRHLVTQVDSSRGEHGHALLGLAVAGLGALVGALIRTEQWAPVPLEALRFRGATN